MEYIVLTIVMTCLKIILDIATILYDVSLFLYLGTDLETNPRGEDSTIQGQNSVVDQTAGQGLVVVEATLDLVALVGVQGSANRPVGLAAGLRQRETQEVGTGMNHLQPVPRHKTLVGEVEGGLGDRVTHLEDQVAPPLVGVEEDLEKKAVGEVSVFCFLSLINYLS